MSDEGRIVRLGEYRWLVHRNAAGYIDEVRDVTAKVTATEQHAQDSASRQDRSR